jgi:hypothetical protein
MTVSGESATTRASGINAVHTEARLVVIAAP